MALFGLKDLMRCLPPLKNATDVCGAVCKETAERTGLREGTPVSGGMFDIDACAVAMDVTDEKNLCVIAGTWSINEFLSKTPVLDGTIMMNSIFALPEYYLVEECSATSAGNHEWFTEMFLQQEKEEAKRLGMNAFTALITIPEPRLALWAWTATIPAPRSSGRCWRAWCSATWFTLKSCCCT